MALICGLAAGALVFFLVRFLEGSESNAAFSLEEVVGTVATVTIPVTPSAIGEVRYIYHGTIHQASARPLLEESFRYGERVLICSGC